MNSFPSTCSAAVDKAAIKAALERCGAYRCGIAAASAVDSGVTEQYRLWIESGSVGELGYMTRHEEIRRSPQGLLPGARSVIVAVFAYPRPSEVEFAPGALRIASYALGDDYHLVLKRRLGDAVSELKGSYGGEYRIAVDTAPLPERYWAKKAGVGYTGLNGMLIVPGAGSCFFIGSIVTTLDIEPDNPCTYSCAGCRRCVAACPAGAIRDTGDGHTQIDCRRCLSCLTIEHHGDFEGEVPRLGKRLYGCDTCTGACPHNLLSPPPPVIPEFKPRPQLLALTAEIVSGLDENAYSALFRKSAIKRAKLEGLRRNAAATSAEKK